MSAVLDAIVAEFARDKALLDAFGGRVRLFVAQPDDALPLVVINEIGGMEDQDTEGAVLETLTLQIDVYAVGAAECRRLSELVRGHFAGLELPLKTGECVSLAVERFGYIDDPERDELGRVVIHGINEFSIIEYTKARI